MRLHTTVIGSVVLSMCGCAVSSSEPEEVKATIVSPSPASIRELQQAVDRALGRHATLADDALTRESVLIIERSTARDPSGRVIEARERTAPERFQLVKRGNDCVLVHERTQTRTSLRQTQCRAAQ